MLGKTVVVKRQLRWFAFFVRRRLALWTIFMASQPPGFFLINGETVIVTDGANP